MDTRRCPLPCIRRCWCLQHSTPLTLPSALVRLNAIPPWWNWYSYLDFIRYSFTALMVNQFDDYDPEFQGCECYGSALVALPRPGLRAGVPRGS